MRVQCSRSCLVGLRSGWRGGTYNTCAVTGINHKRADKPIAPNICNCCVIVSVACCCVYLWLDPSGGDGGGWSYFIGSPMSSSSSPSSVCLSSNTTRKHRDNVLSAHIWDLTPCSVARDGHTVVGVVGVVVSMTTADKNKAV